MTDNNSKRADIINSLQIPETTGKFSPEREATLRQLAQKIAANPEFLAIELKRTLHLIDMLEDGVLDTGEKIDMSLQTSPTMNGYTKYVNAQLKENGIATTVTRTGMGINPETNKRETVTYIVGACGPEGEFVHRLLAKSEEALINRRGSYVHVTVPSAHNPQLVLNASSPAK